MPRRHTPLGRVSGPPAFHLGPSLVLRRSDTATGKMTCPQAPGDGGTPAAASLTRMNLPRRPVMRRSACVVRTIRLNAGADPVRFLASPPDLYIIWELLLPAMSL